MGLSKEAIEEYKAIYRKQYGKDIDDAKATDQAYALMNFVTSIQDAAIDNATKHSMLREKPDGFPVDGQYSCIVCGQGINSKTGWFDEHGSKCLPCTSAVKNGVIPSYICHHHDSYFTMWGLKVVYNLTTARVRKYMRDGELKAREIMWPDGKSVYAYIFLKSENPGLISRYSPERKSYDRHRFKVHDAWARAQAKIKKAEWLKKKTRIDKKYKIR